MGVHGEGLVRAEGFARSLTQTQEPLPPEYALVQGSAVEVETILRAARKKIADDRHAARIASGAVQVVEVTTTTSINRPYLRCEKCGEKTAALVGHEGRKMCATCAGGTPLIVVVEDE